MKLILFLAAIAIAYLVFIWLIKLLQTTFSTALTIAIIVLVLLAVGIGPAQLWQEVNHHFQSLWNLLSGR